MQVCTLRHRPAQPDHEAGVGVAHTNRPCARGSPLDWGNGKRDPPLMVGCPAIRDNRCHGKAVEMERWFTLPDDTPGLRGAPTCASCMPGGGRRRRTDRCYRAVTKKGSRIMALGTTKAQAPGSLLIRRRCRAEAPPSALAATRRPSCAWTAHARDRSHYGAQMVARRWCPQRQGHAAAPACRSIGGGTTGTKRRQHRRQHTCTTPGALARPAHRQAARPR